MHELTQQEDGKPDLGVDCIIWCGGEPMIDRLTEENHYEPYWEESLYAFGDEDCFVLLPKKPIPRKPFDINEYEFSDHDAVIDVAPLTSALRVSTKSGNNAELTESDIDAMKQHFVQMRANK